MLAAARVDYNPAAMDGLVPAHLQEGLRRFIQEGIPTGSGLRAILTNLSLREAIPRLDELAIAGLPGILGFLQDHAPHQCWGSDARVDGWTRAGGLDGGAL